jgi:Protein of unknown function (DUF935)
MALTGAVSAAAPSPNVGAGPYREPTASSEGTQPPAKGVKPWRKTKYRPRLTPLPVNVTRWVQRDVETATLRASQGDMTMVGQLHRAMWRDGTINGVAGTRTGGLVRLPKRFRGTPNAIKKLSELAYAPDSPTSGEGTAQTLFETIFPDSEVAKFDWDAISCGVAIAQFVQGPEDKYPVFTRLDPEFLVYRWAEDRWYYRTLEGLLEIEPGNGRWILFTPMGRYEPWNHGSWRALARSFISKEHAILYRENYGSKLANPARVAIMPQGANEAQKQSWFAKVMGWGINTVFGAPPGYDVKLIESNGRGYEVFEAIIDHADRDAIICITGQTVTVDGGVGFANGDIHKSIRADIIQGDGNTLAGCLNAQALPAVVHDLCGENEALCIEWDTRPPADVAAQAESLEKCADAIERLDQVLTPLGHRVDVPSLCARFAVPIVGDQGGRSVPEAKVRVAEDKPGPAKAAPEPEVPDLDLDEELAS